MCAKLYRVGSNPINAAEQQMVKLLVEGLPDDGYGVIPNVEFAKEEGHPYEYDALVVSPHAVYVIEIKGWNGSVSQLTSDSWELSGGVSAKNPVIQTQLRVKILAEQLKTLFQDERFSQRNTPYVQACVLIANEEMQFDVDEKWMDWIFKPSEVLDFLQDPDALRASRKPRADAYQDCWQEICEYLCGVMKERSAVGRRYGSYITTEVLSLDEERGEFFATHSQFEGEHKYYVRTWYVSPYMRSQRQRIEQIGMLRRAAEALHRVGTHPNLVELRDAGMQEAEFYEVTRWPQGGRLSEAIARGKHQQMSIAERVELILGIVRGLEAAQTQDIHHRNLTPDTILLERDGNPRIGGFDRALLVDSSQTVYGPRNRQRPSGYIAPELRSQEDYKSFANSDLFSVGVIAFELFTGLVPSMDPNALDRASKNIPEQIRDDLVGLINRMRALDTTARPESPTEVRRALEAMLATLRGEAAVAEVPAPPQSVQGVHDLKDVESVPEPVEGATERTDMMQEVAGAKMQPVEDGTPVVADTLAELVRPAMEDARRGIWTSAFIEQLAQAEDARAAAYDALRAHQDAAKLAGDAGLDAALVTNEAQVLALETPLMALAPSLYDALLVARAPLEVGEWRASPAPAPLKVGTYDLVLVLDGLNLCELRHLKQRARADEREVREYSWIAGATHPGIPAEGLAALRQALDGLPEVFDASDARAAPDAWPGGRALHAQLPCAMSTDTPYTLKDLLEMRRGLLDAYLDIALRAAEGTVLVTSTWGTLYTGHGLEVDVGSRAAHAGQGIRALWAASFPDALTRVGTPSQSLRAHVPKPYRDAASPDFGVRRFPVGRLTWGAAHYPPRLLRGGMSLAERVLPLLVIYP